MRRYGIARISRASSCSPVARPAWPRGTTRRRCPSSSRRWRFQESTVGRSTWLACGWRAANDCDARAARAAGAELAAAHEAFQRFGAMP
jgi:hypothetical protein